MTNEPVCLMCEKPQAGHQDMKHPFTLPGQEISTDWLKQKKEVEPEPGPDVQLPMAQFPFDPVLRLALITKGVLTPEDLTSAENQIKAIGGALNNGH